MPHLWEHKSHRMRLGAQSYMHNTLASYTIQSVETLFRSLSLTLQW